MVVQLKRCSKTIIPDTLKKKLSQYKYAFNPSFVVHGQTNYFAIRLYDALSSSIIAVVYIWTDEHDIYIINLSEYFQKVAELAKVSDPKLFVLNDKVWGTFNNGHTEKANNALGLFQIEGFKIKQHYFCQYKNRSRIEKNWNFYSIDNEIFVLYSLSPLTVLKLVRFEEFTAVFENFYMDESSMFNGYTMGTPLVKINDSYLFIAHKKIVINGKRLYLGRAFFLDIGKKIELNPGKKYLIHSLGALFGAKKKFNKNLISCTYFSGICVIKNGVFLSYGINDIKWNTVRTNLKKIWQ